jgi:hypothetical protein
MGDMGGFGEVQGADLGKINLTTGGHSLATRPKIRSCMNVTGFFGEPYFILGS